MLTREECLEAYEVIDTLINLMCGETREDGYEPTMDETVDSMKKIEQLINEHFENTPDFKHFKMYADSTLKSMNKDDLIDYVHMIYFNWKNCDIQLENKIKISNRLYNKLANIHKNPPLKFEELKENMWVWDNVLKDYVKFKRNDDRKIGKILIFSKNDGEEYIRFYRENSFYRREVKDDD